MSALYLDRINRPPSTGALTPLDFGAVGDGVADDTAPMREFVAALPGRQASLPSDAVYRVTERLTIQGGDWTLDANGATLDFSDIANADGDTGGSLVGMAGSTGTPISIVSINVVTNAFSLKTTTVTLSAAHGLDPGDDVMVSSDDIIDTGHNDANERRGQFMRVETVESPTVFTSNQPLYETLVTNPVMTPISWIENVHINGTLRMTGPGRRPTAAGFIGLAMTYVRDSTIGDFETDDVDHQAFVRDNCLRVHADNLTFRFSPQGASTAVQYGDTYKNGTADSTTGSITCYGGKHAFDWTRNTNPGIGGRGCKIGPMVVYDNWDAAATTHGNSRDLRFTTLRATNCLYAFGVRSPGTRVDDIYGENCYEVLKITDDTRDLSVGSVRGKNVGFVVRAKDTPTTSNEGWIGSLESRNINIESVQGLDVTNNTIFLDWSDIPVFTEADAAVTGGSANTIVLDEFPAPAGFDVNQYNFSGALTGSEIAMDWDGAGGGTVQTRTITGHTYAGGVNTLTVSGWTNNPVAGTSTYTIRSFVDDINIGRVISKNCVGSDVFVTGNLRRLVIGDMDVISETNLATAAVLIQGTANTYPDGVTFGAIRRFQKGAPVVSSFAQNVKFEANITDPLILSADPTVDLGAATKQYVDDRTESFGSRSAAVAWVAANPSTTVNILQVANMSFRRSAGATAISDMPDWLPNFQTTPEHFKTNGVGVDMAPAIQSAADYEGPRGTVYFRADTYILGSDSAGTNEGTAVILTSAHSNISFQGQNGTVLTPASNRIEMFAQYGADEIGFYDIKFDNSPNGALDNQLKGTTTVPGVGVAVLGNIINCAVRQYSGASLRVERCVFIEMAMPLHYIGDTAVAATVIGDFVSLDCTFIGCGNPILIDQPKTVLVQGNIDIDGYDIVNSDTGEDPGHLLYVTDRTQPAPFTVVATGNSSYGRPDQPIKIRKGLSVTVTGNSLYNVGRGIMLENVSGGVVDGNHIVLNPVGNANASGIELTGTSYVTVGAANYVNINGADAWGVRALQGLVRGNSNRIMGMTVVDDVALSTGKAAYLWADQDGGELIDLKYVNTGNIGKGFMIDVINATGPQAIIIRPRYVLEGTGGGRGDIVVQSRDGCDPYIEVTPEFIDAGYDAARFVQEVGTGTARVFAKIETTLQADMTVNIPTDYPTLAAAIAATSYLRPNGFEIILNIESGHALTAGLRLENFEGAHYRITSVDARVNLAAGFTAVDAAEWPTGAIRVSIFAFLNSRAPVLDCIIDGQLAVTPDTFNINGYMCGFGGDYRIQSGAGVCGVRNNLECREGVLHAQGAVLEDAHEFCARITSGCLFSLRNASIKNSFVDISLADDRAGGVLISRGSYGTIQDALLEDHPRAGISIRRSHVAGNGTLFVNCVPRAVQFFDGGIFIVNSTTLVDAAAIEDTDLSIPGFNAWYGEGACINSNLDVLETIADANGIALKHANGTALVISPTFTVAVTTADGGGFRSAAATWDYSSLINIDDTNRQISAHNQDALFTFYALRPLSTDRVNHAALSFTSQASATYTVTVTGYWS